MTRHRDRGAILPMVLLVIVFLSVVVVGTARYASANLRYGMVVRDRAVATAAAESGARYGVARARTNSLTTCGEVGDGPVALVPTSSPEFPATTDVTVTCERLDSGRPTLAGWAAVATGEGAVPNRSVPYGTGRWIEALRVEAVPVTSGHVGTGRMYVPTPLQADLRINRDDATIDGDLFYDGGGDCATIREYDGSDVTYDDDIVMVGGSFVCWPRPWDRVVAEPPIPTPYPTAPQPPAGDGATSGCRVFAPGHYSNATGGLDLLEGGDNYFRSGTYLFENVVIDIGGSGTTTVLAGYPHDATYRNDLIDFSPVGGACAAAQADDGLAGGRGVTWYLGGSSRIFLRADSYLELLPMVHSASGQAHAVSVHVLGPTSPLGPQSTLPTSTPVIDAVRPGDVHARFRGQIWAPFQSVDLANVHTHPVPFIAYGVVAAYLRFDATTDADPNGRIGPDTTPVEHRLRIRSVAKHNGQVVEVEAIIDHRPNAPVGSRVAVRSLRVVD